MFDIRIIEEDQALPPVAFQLLFLSVLLYNFAIRFLPWVIGKLGTFLSFLCGKAKDLFLYVRRECYQL